MNEDKPNADFKYIENSGFLEFFKSGPEFKPMPELTPKQRKTIDYFANQMARTELENDYVAGKITTQTFKEKYNSLPVLETPASVKVALTAAKGIVKNNITNMRPDTTANSEMKPK